MGFKVMFRMSVSDYEFLSSQISDLIQPNERISGNRSVPSNKGLTLTLRCLATGDSIQSPSYKLRMSLVVASLHCKGCCTVINDKLQNMFIEFPNSRKRSLRFPEN